MPCRRYNRRAPARASSSTGCGLGILALVGSFAALALVCVVVSFALSVTQATFDGLDRLWQLSPLLVIVGAIISAVCVGFIVWAATNLYVLNRAERMARQQAQAAEAERIRQMQIAEAERARQAHIARLKTLEGLLSLTSGGFEDAVGQMLAAHGYRDVQRTGGAGDLMADLTCIAPDGRRTVVQCKRYAPDNLVGSQALQSFIGMVNVHHRAQHGIFVTTSGYTQPAMKLAQDHATFLRLIDGPEVAELMQRIS